VYPHLHFLVTQFWQKKAQIFISFVKISTNKLISLWNDWIASRCTKVSLFSKVGWYALMSGLTLLVIVAGYNPKALSQQDARFTCDRTLYISQGQQRTTLNRVNTRPFALNPIGTADVEYNAIGFNIRDNSIYAMVPQSAGNNPPVVYRISANGAATSIGSPTAFPVLAGNSGAFAFSGDIDRNGNYVVYITNQPAGQPNLFDINLSTNTVVRSLTLVGTNFADIAFNPVNDQLYAFDNTQRQIARIDLTNGQIQYFGTRLPGNTVVGGSFFDSFGNFFAYDDTGSLLIARDIANPANPNPGQFQRLGTVRQVDRFDGASCAVAPSMEKTVEPQTVVAGNIVTYRYRIANGFSNPLPNLTFRDVLPEDGRTFVAGTLNNPLGGTLNAFGGTRTLEITGVTLPGRTITEITVQVLVPRTTRVGTVFNQATLGPLPSNPTVPELLSDYPFPPGDEIPDPTPLQVTANPTIGVAKSQSSVINQGNGNFQVTFTITLKNLGNIDLNAVQVTENLSNTFGATPFTVNRVSSPSVNLTPNTNFNGTTDTNLLSGTNILAIGETKTIELIVTITPGSNLGPYRNQAEATAVSPSGTPTRDTSTSGLNPDPDNDGNPTNNNDSTPVDLSTPTTTEPRLRLVKRITNATRRGVPISGINFNNVVDDLNDTNDNVSGWSQLPGRLLGVPSLGPETSLESGDDVEYTVYFLSDGSLAVKNVRLCDPIPPKTTFIPDSFELGRGILINQNGIQTPQSNAADTDQGTFTSPLTPVTAPCPNANNPNGAVLVQLGDIANTAPNNVGFVRFRIKID
jgi:uncharacterized repeat protein (TIGR01451 family)